MRGIEGRLSQLLGKHLAQTGTSLGRKVGRKSWARKHEVAMERAKGPTHGCSINAQASEVVLALGSANQTDGRVEARSVLS